MSYLYWFALAGGLLVLEMVLPGAFFLWIGIAAAVTALLVSIVSMGLKVQVGIFAALSVVSMIVWRKWYRNPVASDQPYLNRRGEQYIDRTFTLSAPIENGYGKIRVDDSYWKIEGDDCEAGKKVKVVGVDGVILQVEVV